MNKINTYTVVKKVTDVTLSLVGLIISIPIIGLFCILVKLESKGPCLYSQERLGLNGKEFRIFKIRSMYDNAEKDGIQWATDCDERVTKVGRFIRKTRIDELPQLINILKGDMSIVGPRPERRYFYDEFEKELLDFRKRLAVKPGLSGLAQVNGGYDLSPKEKLEYDLFYIDNFSLKLDMIIIFKTFKVIITGDGSR